MDTKDKKRNVKKGADLRRPYVLQCVLELKGLRRFMFVASKGLTV